MRSSRPLSTTLQASAELIRWAGEEERLVIKPMLKDFFINARLLFGFMGPGGLWIASLLVVINTNLNEVIKNASASEVIIFLAASFVVGHAMAAWSFQVGFKLSEKLEVLIDRLRRTQRLPLDKERQATLTSQVRQIIKQQYGDGDYLTQIKDNDLPHLCKRFLIENTTRFAREIDEIEAEINLRAGFALAIVVFSASWVLHHHQQVDVALAVFLLLTAFLLLRRVAPTQRHERRLWCELFLLVQITRGSQKPNRVAIDGDLPNPALNTDALQAAHKARRSQGAG